MRTSSRLAWIVWLAVGLPAGLLPVVSGHRVETIRSARAKVYHSRESALELAFPPPAVVRSREIFLSERQVEEVRRRTGETPPSRMISVYEGWREAELVGYAYIVSHRVRTLPETLMVTLTPDGAVEAIRLLAFHEPSEYEPPVSYLERFGGARDPRVVETRSRDWAVAGSTLSCRAIRTAVRRILAVHQVAVAGTSRPPDSSGSSRKPPSPNPRPAHRAPVPGEGEALVAPPSAADFEEAREWVMGTVLRIVLPAAADDSLFTACFARARRLDAMLSPFRKGSALSGLSARKGSWVPVPPEVLDYLDLSRSQSRRTGGAFDITLHRRGWRDLDVDPAAGRARWRAPEADGVLDSGGNGKGFALDALGRLLRDAGVDNALLDFGGSSLLAIGPGPGGKGWSVAIRGPAHGTERGRIVGRVLVTDAALSVSSTMKVEDGEDGSLSVRPHLWDLRDGRRVESPRTAVVVAASASAADAYSTALAITGRGLPAIDGTDAPFAWGIFSSSTLLASGGSFSSRFSPEDPRGTRRDDHALNPAGPSLPGRTASSLPIVRRGGPGALPPADAIPPGSSTPPGGARSGS